MSIRAATVSCRLWPVYFLSYAIIKAVLSDYFVLNKVFVIRRLELAPCSCAYHLEYQRASCGLYDKEVATKWTHVKRIWDVLKDKIGQFWDYLSGRSYPILRLIPARAARRRPKARALRKAAEAPALDPNRFQLD
jgi:hypothetical protein